jgi:hypothetical protein
MPVLGLIHKFFFYLFKKEIYLISKISVIKDLALNPDLDPDHNSPTGLYADSVSLN